MGLAAAVLAVVAALFYPWPEPVETSAQVNQKLFPDLDVKQVRNMAIASFDRENRRFNTIQLKRVRDAWFVPSAGDYPAGNVSRIAAVFDTLGESTILEVKSSDESTHQLYGVIDSDVLSDVANQSGIGTKISLTDNNNRPLAELIVGESVSSNKDQRFVRVAGQPNVYVIDLPASLLSTQLSDWVDHNLLDLKLSATGPGLDIARLEIDNYVVEGETFDNQKPKKYNFRAIVDPKNSAAPLTLSKPGEDGKLGDPVSDRGLNSAGLNALASHLAQIQFSAAGKTPPAAAKALLAGIDSQSDLSSLANFGFRVSSDSPSKLDAKNGQLRVFTTEGVTWTLSFGSVVGSADAAQSRVNYYLLITATVDELAFPMPPEPVDKENAEQKTDYERALKRREANLASARERAKQYNDRQAIWLFLISEEALLALRPDETALVQ